MRKLLKKVLYRLAPKWTAGVVAARSRAHSHRLNAGWGNGPVVQKLIGRFGNKVQEGPFAGLTLTPMTHAEQFGPYLLGVYESDLDDAWERVFRGAYTQILDVGAKIGYYAVGLAKKYPQASVVAFDTDGWARQATREMAAANAAGNVKVEGFCSTDWLEKNLQPAAFIISDCEGYEGTLFGVGMSPRLQTATLIIETHDVFVPGVSDKLLAAFRETHDVHLYDSEGPPRATTFSLDDLSESEREFATVSVRSPTRWLLCLPRTGPNQALRQAAGGPC